MPYLVFALVMQQLGKKPIPPIIRNLTGAIGMEVFKQIIQPRLTEQFELIALDSPKTLIDGSSNTKVGDVDGQQQ